MAAADADTASADLDPELALDRNLGQHRQARLLLLPVVAQPRQRNREIAGAIRQDSRRPRAEARDGVWYFLKNCLKGHLRREGRQLTAGPGIPYIAPSEFRNYLKFADPTTPLLGDAEDWSDLERSQSIIVGSPETVYRRIFDLIEHAKAGHLLIQFHMGNMADALTRKSMRLFADEVAPRLKADSARLFARQFPELERTPEPAQ